MTERISNLRRANRRGWFGALLTGLVGWAASGQAESPVSPEARAESRDLIVWSWRADTAERIDGVTPMVVVSFNYGHRPKRVGTDYHTARPDHEIGREVFRTIDTLRRDEALPEGHLALRLWYVGGTADPMRPAAPRGLFPEGFAAEALRRGGFTEHTEDLVRRVMQRLHLGGVEPDFLVLDYESGANRWQIGRREGKFNPVAYRQDLETIFEEAGSTMPPTLRDLGPQALVPGHRDYLTALPRFNAWAFDRRSVALRRGIIEPFNDAFGRDVPASNYAEQVRAWPTHDLNGVVNPVRDRITGTWSSPVTYLKTLRGNRFRGMEPRAALAKAWTDRRNEVRAALAWSSDVAPWYSNPDDGRPEEVDVDTWRWAWAAGLMHDRKHGVCRMLLWSGASWTDAEVAFAQRVFASLHDLPPSKTAYAPNLQPVPTDEADAWLAGWIERAREAVGDPQLPGDPSAQPTR
ncbi:MAG: hypothetical protein AAGF84_06140 [Planctomycetota bacterium]